MDVLVTCPSARDRKALAQVSGYTFHLLDAKLNARTPSPECDILDYIERCRQYIRTHHIDAIYYSRDVADIVGAALCEEFGFPGPSIESVFLCLHKYYARRSEPSPIRCEAIELFDNNPSVTAYPCYLKPPWLNLGILGFKLESPDDLQRALAVARREYHFWSPLYYPFFQRYVDLQKYPLAVQDIMLVEEFIDGPQVTVEGWVHNNQVSLWAITDTNTYPGTRVIDNFSLPSRQPAHIQEKLAKHATAAIHNIGLNNGFFNIEFWCHEKSVTLTEINGRAATCFYHLYRHCLDACIYEAGLALACGRNPALLLHLNGTVGAQCNFVTFGTDWAENLIDFTRARTIPQLALYVAEGDWVKPVSEFGFVLAQIDLFGYSYAEIKEEIDRLRHLLLKQPATSPW